MTTIHFIQHAISDTTQLTSAAPSLRTLPPALARYLYVTYSRCQIKQPACLNYSSYMSVWPVLSNITLMEKEHTLKRRFLKQIHLRLKMIILHMDRDCSFKIPLERELAYSISMKPLWDSHTFVSSCKYVGSLLMYARLFGSVK